MISRPSSNEWKTVEERIWIENVQKAHLMGQSMGDLRGAIKL